MLFVFFSHHAWVSAIEFSEAYNEAIRVHDEWRSNKPGGNAENWRLQCVASQVDQSTMSCSMEGNSLHHYVNVMYTIKSLVKQ